MAGCHGSAKGESWRDDPGPGGRLHRLFSERNEAVYQAQACVQSLAAEAPATRKETT